MIETLALKTSTKAKDRAQALTKAGKSWQNNGSSCMGTPITDSQKYLGSGQLAGRSQLASNEFHRAIELGELDFVIWSYRTPIAWHYGPTMSNDVAVNAARFVRANESEWVTGNGWVIPDVRYSATTTQHQSIARVIAASVPTIGTGDSK